MLDKKDVQSVPRLCRQVHVDFSWLDTTQFLNGFP